MTSNLTVFLVEDDKDLQLGCVQALQLADIAVRAFDSVEAVQPHLCPGLPQSTELKRSEPAGH